MPLFLDFFFYFLREELEESKYPERSESENIYISRCLCFLEFLDLCVIWVFSPESDWSWLSEDSGKESVEDLLDSLSSEYNPKCIIFLAIHFFNLLSWRRSAAVRSESVTFFWVHFLLSEICTSPFSVADLNFCCLCSSLALIFARCSRFDWGSACFSSSSNRTPLSLIDRSASEISWSRRDSSSSFGELNFQKEDVDPVLPEDIDTLLPPEDVPFVAKGELCCNLSGVWDFDLAAVAAKEVVVQNPSRLWKDF